MFFKENKMLKYLAVAALLLGLCSTSFLQAQSSTGSWNFPSPVPYAVNNGGDIVYASGTYWCMVGNSQRYFYKYDSASDSWSRMADLPSTINYGALAYPGSGDYIYATRGYWSQSFYQYSISGNNWTTLANVPGGIYYGTDMVTDGNTKIYCMRGYGGNQFYVYTIGGAWTTLTSCPGNVSYGGSLAYDPAGTGTIYAFAGNSQTFWKYDVLTNAWNPTDPTDPTSGNRYDGASLIYPGSGDFIYATRGNNTTVFEKYSISGDSWTALNTTPMGISGGGRLATDGSTIFVLAGGNRTPVFNYSIASGNWGNLTPPSATINYGGDMAYKPGSDFIYVSRGNNTGTIYSYSISGDLWAPETTATSNIYYGGSLIYRATDDSLYVLFGNGTTFRKYAIGGAWTDLTSVPGAVGYGADMVYTGSNDIYILRGGYYSTFWKYDIAGDSFTAMTSAPNLVYQGGDLCYPGSGDYIYVLRGYNSTDFWRYSISGNSWSTLSSTPSNVNIGGSMVYPGGGDYIYAIRGANTSEFWRYSISNDTWSSSISQAPLLCQQGASLVRAGDYMYLLSGNNTTGFAKFMIWGEALTPVVNSISPNYDSILGGTPVTITGDNFSLSSTVDFGGTAGTNINILDWATITCDTPAVGAGQVNVNVVNPGPLTGTLTNGFEYFSRPMITDFSPKEISPTGGTAMTITGYNFNAGATVTIDGNACTSVNVVDPNTITCDAPAGSAFAGTLKVENTDLQSDSLEHIVRYTVLGTYNQPKYIPDTIHQSSHMTFVPNVGGKDYIYMFKCQNTNTFWRYEISGNTWETMATAPSNFYYGADLYYPGTGDTIYAFRGGNTNTFWGYSISGNSWITTLATAPATLYQWGADMTYDAGNNCLWVLGGKNSTAFWKYDIAGDSWSSPANQLPAGANQGCSIVYPGTGTTVYAVRGGNTSSFYAYDTVGQTWSSLTAVPANVAEGAAMTYPGSGDYLYLLSGARNRSFYRYSMSGNSWEALSNSPFRITWGGDLVAVGSDWLYATCGTWSYYWRNLFRFSLKDLKWEGMDLPYEYDRGAQVEYVDIDNSLYFTKGNNTNNFYKYDLTTESYTILSSTPGNTSLGSSLKYPGTGDYIYCIRGAGQVSFYRYSISGDTWVSMSNLPSAANTGSGLTYVSSNNSLYAIPGNNSTYFYRYDIATDSWSSLSTLPSNAYYGCDLAYPGSGDYIYCQRGSGGSNFYRYSITGDSWTSMANLPAGSSYDGALIAGKQGNYIYGIFGGVTLNLGRYDIANNSWSNLQYLPFNSYYGADITATTDSLYILSGHYEWTRGFMKYTLYSPNTAPSISDITPSSGAISGGNTITANGSYFYPGLTVTVDGNSATNVQFLSDSQITFDIPSGTVGAKDIVITNPGGYSDTLVGGFTYIDDPIIDSISPKSGPTSGGLTVTISGYNFQSGAIVTIGGNPATGVNVINSWTISCVTPASTNFMADVYVENPDAKNDTLQYAFSYEGGEDWTEIKPLPNTAYYGSCLEYVNGKIYFMRGYDSQQFYEYDVTTNTWSTLQNTPSTVYYGADLCYPGTGDYIYATRGNGQTGFWRYSISGGTWDDLGVADVPVGLSYGSALAYANVGGDFIYVTQGNNGTAFYKYDISLNTWSGALAVVPGSVWFGGDLYYPGSGDYIYCLRGNNTTNFYAYSISGNSWVTTLSTVPASVSDGGALAGSSDSNKIYCARGNNSKNFYVYDISSDSWTSAKSTLRNYYRGGRLLYITGTDYIFGFPADGTYDFNRYSISNNTWNILQRAPYNVSGGANIIGLHDSDTMYISVGNNQTYFYKYSVSADTWTSMQAIPGSVNYGCDGVVDSSDTYIYLLRGNNTTDFYRYDIAGDSWSSLSGVPIGVRYGGSLSYPGFGDYIYAISGNNTTNFYRYSISGDSWTALSDYPLSVYYGGSLFYYAGNNSLYCTRGNNTSNFYRYSIDSNMWISMSSTPAGIYYGGDLLYPGVGDTAYLIRGNNSINYYGYSLNSNAWSTLSSVPDSVSYGGRLGYPGGGEYIYCMPANGTNYFLKYRMSSSDLISVSSVIPSTGPNSGGNEVIITGVGFRPGLSVKFGSNNSTSVNYLTPTKISAIVPAGTNGAVDITVTNTDLTSDTLSSGFTYDSSVIVTSVTPLYGGTSGGNTITIKGYNFQSGATVTVGGASATNVTIVDDQTITATTPAGTDFASDIVVTNTDLQSDTLVSTFRYDALNYWSEPSKIPAAVGYDGDLVWDGGNLIYAIRANNSTDFYSYNLNTDVWTTLQAPSSTFSSGASLCIADDSGTDYVYAFRGSGTTTFWRYDIGGDSWLPMATTPAAVSNGGALYYPGSGDYIYALRGGTTSSFWRYSISGNVWDDPGVADIAYNVNSGGALTGCYNSDYIFCIPSNSQTVLLRYSISGDTWTTMTSAPASLGNGADMITSDDGLYLYVNRGLNTTTFYKYSILDDSWGTLNNAPYLFNYGGALVNIVGSDYFYGIRGSNSTEFYRYNKRTDSWTNYASMPAGTDRGSDCVYVKSENSLYITKAGNTKDFWKYSIADDSWVNLAQTPINVYTGGAMEYPGSGDYIYLLPGGSTVNSFYQYSISNDTWSLLAYAPGFIGQGCAMESDLGDYLYVFQGNSTDFWRYSISGDVWDILAIAPATTGYGASLCYPGSGTTIYALRGNNTNTLWSYDITGDTWNSSLTAAPSSIYYGADMAYPGTGDDIYVMRGNNSSDFYSYDFILDSWTNLSSTTPVPSIIGYSGKIIWDEGNYFYATYGGSYAGLVSYHIKALPILSSVEPPIGYTGGGNNVTITGENFVTGATVDFGGSAATNVVVVDASQITCDTPAGVAGPVDVVVTIPGPLSDTLTNGFTYSSNPSPTISSVTPDIDDESGGLTITISGTNFVSGSTVYIDTTPASNVNFVASDTLTCDTPGMTSGVYDVKVTNPDSQYIILQNGFTYSIAPSVVSINPTSGISSGGEPVTITGTAFQSGATVTIAGNSATNVVFVNSTSITCDTPGGPLGAADVVVINPDTLSGTLSSGFTYNPAPPPVISNINPDNGDFAGGTSVTITGTGFAAGATVKFGATDASGIVIVNSTTITCSSPAGSIGTVSVTVTNQDTQYDYLFNGYTYNPPASPSIVSISPSNGPMTGGTSVTITGTDFDSGATVTIGGQSATNITFVNSTSITCDTPVATIPGTVNVTVINSDLQETTLLAGYTYDAPAGPYITNISPDSGIASGGTSVTITGGNFDSGASVTIGGNPVSNTVIVNTTTITCDTSAGASGQANVKVTNSDNQSYTLIGGFTYLLSPSIISVSPSNGDLGGGTAVVVTGLNFENGTGLNVQFGGSDVANLTFVNSTTLTMTTPASALEGAVDIVVTNPSGLTATLTDGFLYQNPPPIANAGLDQTLDPATVLLDGSASTNTTGGNDGLTYAWSQVSGISVTFDDNTLVTPSFVATKSGEYTFQLIVTEGTYISVADMVTITINNVAPVADAGSDQTAIAGDPVTLDGSGSYDNNTDNLTYSWTPSDSLDDGTQIKPVFDSTDKAGVYTFTLEVSDGVSTSTDTVNITITGSQSGPYASAGPDIDKDKGETVTLDASASKDTDGSIKTYNWTYVSGPLSEVSLTNGTSATPTFTPTSAGIYVFQLTVTDNTDENSLADLAYVYINDPDGNNYPVAKIVPSKVYATVGNIVILDGETSTDTDGDELTYKWEQIGGDSISMSSTSTSRISISTDTPGAYKFKLSVNDGKIWGTSDEITIFFNDVNAKQYPFAVAKLSQSTDPDGNNIISLYDSSLISLNGSDSTGEGTLTYSWTQASGPPVLISDNTTEEVVIYITSGGIYEFELMVTDENGLTSTDDLQFAVDYYDAIENTTGNNIPIADAGPSINAEEGATVTLDGSNSYDSSEDSDGITSYDDLTFYWVQVAGPNVELDNPNSYAPKFIPTVSGSYKFKLQVGDGIDFSLDDYVTVTVEASTEVTTVKAGSELNNTDNSTTYTLPKEGSNKASCFITKINKGVRPISYLLFLSILIGLILILYGILRIKKGYISG